MTPLLTASWVPPDGSGMEAVVLLRRLLRKARQEQIALPEALLMRSPMPNTVPQLDSERLAAALGLSALRDTVLSLVTPAPPGDDVPQLIARGLLRPQVCFRDPVGIVATLRWRDPRGRPARGAAMVASFEDALSLLDQVAPVVEAWLALPEVLPLDLDVLAEDPGRTVRALMAQIGIVQEKPGETAGFILDWTQRPREPRPAAPLSSAEAEAVRARFGALHARFVAAAEAAEPPAEA
ncbi:MAG: hypothetical protein N2Z67_04260 [Acetobacteraceae bacterium]|nr:hypothetical protein [Acetobacteraceae bacterium]